MKTLRLLSIGALCSLILASCQKAENTGTQSFQLDKTSVTLLNGEAGQQDIMFTATNVTPTVSVDTAASEWLAAKVDGRAITVTYTRNTTGIDRTGVINVTPGTLAAQTITVTQPKYKSPTGQELKVGDVVEESGVKGVVYWVDPADAANGKIVSVARTTGLMWGQVGEETGAVSQVNGAANTAMLATSSYPAAYYCSQLGTGWYLPSKQEMTELFSVYNGLDASSATIAQPKDITAAEQQARADFDAYLTGAGGEKMNTAADNNNGNSYWTSTEYSSDVAWFVRFGKYTAGTDVNKTSESRYVRCIRVIGTFQYPAEPVSMSFTPGSLSFAGSAATSDVAVKVGFGTLASAQVDAEGASWCSASIGEGKVSVTVTANDSGQQRSTTVYVTANSTTGADPLIKELSVTQAANGKYKVGDVVYESEKAVGIVFWINETGNEAKIIALKRSGKVAWATEGCPSGADATEIGCSDADNGATNTSMIISFVGANTGDLPWLPYLQGLGDGWYIPAHNELKTLFEAYNGTTFGGATAKVYDQCTEAEIAARNKFNKALTDLGGDPVDDKSQTNGDQYMSSDESKEGDVSAATEVYSVRFGKASLNKNTAKKGNTRYFRAVKLVK